MTYKDELGKAMNLLAQDERILFIGQSVAYSGQTMTPTLEHVPPNKKLEMPIAEDMQMGMSIGLALKGILPVSLFSRFDFLLVACNQLVNHLDKIPEMSNNHFKPKVIIRTIVGATKPLYPGPQHCSDYTDALRLMLRNIEVYKLDRAEDIIQSYQKALESERSSILIEEANLYGG